MRKSNKYGSKQTTVDGITFSSKREADRYAELRIMERAGLITGLALQPRYTLREGYEFNGRRVRPITYIADFAYVDEHGKQVVEDVKGVRTEVYRLKKKLFERRYGIEITEI